MRRRNIGFRVGRTGLKLSLYHFLPMRPVFTVFMCTEITGSHLPCRVLDEGEGYGQMRLSEDVQPTVGIEQTAPLSSSSSRVSNGLSGLWVLGEQRLTRTAGRTFTQLGYHLSVFRASFEILKKILRHNPGIFVQAMLVHTDM